MACVYTYVHTYICIHYQVYVRASQTHASRQLPPGLSDTRVHQASSIKARARESDRALDGAAADFDPSRRPPEPHFAFPHARPDSTPSPRPERSQGAPPRPVDSVKWAQAPPALLVRASSPTALRLPALLLPPTRAVRLESPSHTNTSANTAPPCSAVAATPARRRRRRYPRPRPASSAMLSLS